MQKNFSQKIATISKRNTNIYQLKYTLVKFKETKYMSNQSQLFNMILKY